MRTEEPGPLSSLAVHMNMMSEGTACDWNGETFLMSDLRRGERRKRFQNIQKAVTTSTRNKGQNKE